MRVLPPASPAPSGALHGCPFPARGCSLPTEKFPEVATGHGAAGIRRRVPRMRLVPTLHRAPINNRHATFQRGSVLSPLHAGRWELRGYTRCPLCRGAAPSPPRHTPDPVMRKLRGAADPSFIPYAMPEAGQSLSACAGAPQSWAGGKGSPPRGTPYLSPPCLRSRASTALEIPTREETYPSFGRN